MCSNYNNVPYTCSRVTCQHINMLCHISLNYTSPVSTTTHCRDFKAEFTFSHFLHIQYSKKIAVALVLLLMYYYNKVVIHREIEHMLYREIYRYKYKIILDSTECANCKVDA